MVTTQLRIGVASVMQETNTWSPVPCTMDDFRCQDLAVGQDVLDRYAGTSTEVGGALRAIMAAGHEAVPLMRAWANSSGRLTSDTLMELQALLVAQLRSQQPLQGLVLSLHGAMAADGIDDADLHLVRAARSVLGPDIPIAVCFDLHANVTTELVRETDVLTGYHTYPHTDLEITGARTARLLLDLLAGHVRPVTALAKRFMLVPAETMSTSSGPLAAIRAEADALTAGRTDVLDVSLFPVQPWLDVEQLGLAVTVTTDGDAATAQLVADDFADRVWELRESFTVDLLTPVQAIHAARASQVRPFLISESSDAPTAGGAGDSSAMLRALLEHGSDMPSCITLTDPAAVAVCAAHPQGRVDVMAGGALDPRYSEPVCLQGVVMRIGSDPVLLTGPSYTGTLVSMGRYALVRCGSVNVLLTERPAFTLDPATYRHVGIDVNSCDVVVVRSANGFRAAYPPESVASAVLLDLPGPSTPRLELLDFVRAPRPLFPVDRETRAVEFRAPQPVLQDG